MSLRTASQQRTLRGLTGKATWEQRQARKQEEARAAFVVCVMLLVVAGAIAMFGGQV